MHKGATDKDSKAGRSPELNDAQGVVMETPINVATKTKVTVILLEHKCGNKKKSKLYFI